MGPGTHVAANVTQHRLPVNRADAIAVVHDIEYLISTNSKQQTSRADQHAIAMAGYSAPELILTTGLTLRNYFDLPFNLDNSTVHSQQKRALGEKLKGYVLNDPTWKSVIVDRYGLNFEL